MAPGILPQDPTVEPSTMSKAPKTTTPKPHEEYQYLDLIRDILANGEFRPDR